METNLRFAKLHGLGNDFIVSRLPAGKTVSGNSKSRSALPLRRLARAICQPHTGVGADGFLAVLPPRTRANDARVRFFNADGSEAEISGNGIRCVGGFLMKAGNRKKQLRIETLAGVKVLEAVQVEARRWQFRVGMGRPIFEPAKIPFAAKGAVPPVVGFPLRTKHGQHRVTVTSMGNPHCSLFVRSFDRVDWAAIGRELESHPYFPNRTNVEFVKVISRGEIEVRFWERGVGITASSGTGSCGAAVASILNGYTDRRVRVRTTAGTLSVDWPEQGEVVLTGPAEWIAEGVYSFAG